MSILLPKLPLEIRDLRLNLKSVTEEFGLGQIRLLLLPPSKQRERFSHLEKKKHLVLEKGGKIMFEIGLATGKEGGRERDGRKMSDKWMRD